MAKSSKLRFGLIHVLGPFEVEDRPEAHRFRFVSKTKEACKPPKWPFFSSEEVTPLEDYTLYSDFFNVRFYRIDFRPNQVFYSRKDGVDLFVKDCDELSGYLFVKNIVLWQEIMGDYFEKLILRLKGFELVEFLFFNISDIIVDDTVEESIEKGYPFRIKINMVLVVRSLVGADLFESFDKRFILGRRSCWDDKTRRLVRVLNFEEAEKACSELYGSSQPLFFDEAGGGVLPEYYYGSFDSNDAALKGWFWFRVNDFSDWSTYNNNKRCFWEFNREAYFSVWDFRSAFFSDRSYTLKKNTKWGGEDLERSERLSTLSHIKNNRSVRGYLYSLGSSKREGSEWKSIFLHPHSRILGSTAKTTYDLPTVLLSLIRSYCILKGIRSFGNLLYVKGNEEGSFFKPFPNNSIGWFDDNIMEIMNYLAEQFPITFSVLDVHLLITKQLSNALEILKINLDGFLDLATEEQDFFERKLITRWRPMSGY